MTIDLSQSIDFSLPENMASLDLTSSTSYSTELEEIVDKHFSESSQESENKQDNSPKVYRELSKTLKQETENGPTQIDLMPSNVEAISAIAHSELAIDKKKTLSESIQSDLEQIDERTGKLQLSIQKASSQPDFQLPLSAINQLKESLIKVRSAIRLLIIKANIKSTDNQTEINEVCAYWNKIYLKLVSLQPITSRIELNQKFGSLLNQNASELYFCRSELNKFNEKLKECIEIRLNNIDYLQVNNLPTNEKEQYDEFFVRDDTTLFALELICSNSDHFREQAPSLTALTKHIENTHKTLKNNRRNILLAFSDLQEGKEKYIERSFLSHEFFLEKDSEIESTAKQFYGKAYDKKLIELRKIISSFLLQKAEISKLTRELAKALCDLMVAEITIINKQFARLFDLYKQSGNLMDGDSFKALDSIKPRFLKLKERYRSLKENLVKLSYQEFIDSDEVKKILKRIPNEVKEEIEFQVKTLNLAHDPNNPLKTLKTEKDLIKKALLQTSAHK